MMDNAAARLGKIWNEAKGLVNFGNIQKAMSRASNALEDMAANARGFLFSRNGNSSIASTLENDGTKALGSRGVRNQEPFTNEQIAELRKNAGQLKIAPADIEFGSRKSYWSDMMDKIILGPDALPAPASSRVGGSVFERIQRFVAETESKIQKADPDAYLDIDRGFWPQVIEQMQDGYL